MIRKFKIEDFDISPKYDSIVDQLEEIEFYIKLDEDGYYEFKEGASLDMVWDIGYYSGGVNYDNHKYWVDILAEIVDTSENSMDDEEYDLYVDFMSIFEDLCVKECEEFEEFITLGK